MLIFINLFTLLLVSSCTLYWPVLCRRAQIDCTASNTVEDLLLPNTVDQKDEKPYTAGLDTVTDVPLGKLLAEHLSSWHIQIALNVGNRILHDLNCLKLRHWEADRWPSRWQYSRSEKLKWFAGIDFRRRAHRDEWGYNKVNNWNYDQLALKEECLASNEERMEFEGSTSGGNAE